MKDWKEVEGWIEEEVGPILAELAKDKVLLRLVVIKVNLLVP